MDAPVGWSLAEDVKAIKKSPRLDVERTTRLLAYLSTLDATSAAKVRIDSGVSESAFDAFCTGRSKLPKKKTVERIGEALVEFEFENELARHTRQCQLDQSKRLQVGLASEEASEVERILGSLSPEDSTSLCTAALRLSSKTGRRNSHVLVDIEDLTWKEMLNAKAQKAPEELWAATSIFGNQKSQPLTVRSKADLFNPTSKVSEDSSFAEVKEPIQNARILVSLALLCGLIHNYDVMIGLLLRSIRLIKQRGGEFKVLEGRILAELGSTYGQAGDLEVSVTYLEDALQAFEEVEKSHQLIPIVLVQLARAYSKVPDLEKLTDCKQRCLQFLEKNGSLGHALDMFVMSNLVLLYMSTGQMDQADIVLRSAFKSRPSESHMSDASSAYVHASLGIIAFHRNEVEVAMKHLTTARSIFLEIQGANSPEAAKVLGNQGVIEHARGNHAKAWMCLSSALHTLKQSIPENNAVVSSALMNLGSVLLSLGESAEALKLLNEAHNIHTSLNVTSHGHSLETVRIRCNLGVAHGKLGDLRQQLTHLLHAYSMLMNLAGGGAVTHKQINLMRARLLDDLGCAIERLGSPLTALQRCREAFELANEIKFYMPSKAAFLTHCAVLECVINGPSVAEPLIHWADKVMDKYRLNHIDACETKCALACFSACIGDTATQLKLLNETLSIQQQFYRKIHPDIATTLAYLGNAHVAAKDFQKGITYLEQALQQQLSCLPPHSIETIKTLVLLHEAYLGLGLDKQAREYAERVSSWNCSIVHTDLVEEDLRDADAIFQRWIDNLETLNPPFPSTQIRVKRIGSYIALIPLFYSPVVAHSSAESESTEHFAESRLLLATQNADTKIDVSVPTATVVTTDELPVTMFQTDVDTASIGHVDRTMRRCLTSLPLLVEHTLGVQRCSACFFERPDTSNNSLIAFLPNSIVKLIAEPAATVSIAGRASAPAVFADVKSSIRKIDRAAVSFNNENLFISCLRGRPIMFNSSLMPQEMCLHDSAIEPKNTLPEHRVAAIQPFERLCNTNFSLSKGDVAFVIDSLSGWTWSCDVIDVDSVSDTVVLQTAEATVEDVADAAGAPILNLDLDIIGIVIGPHSPLDDADRLWVRIDVCLFKSVGIDRLAASFNPLSRPTSGGDSQAESKSIGGNSTEPAKQAESSNGTSFGGASSSPASTGPSDCGKGSGSHSDDDSDANGSSESGVSTTQKVATPNSVLTVQLAACNYQHDDPGQTSSLHREHIRTDFERLQQSWASLNCSHELAIWNHDKTIMLQALRTLSSKKPPNQSAKTDRDVATTLLVTYGHGRLHCSVPEFLAHCFTDNDALHNWISLREIVALPWDDAGEIAVLWHTCLTVENQSISERVQKRVRASWNQYFPQKFIPIVERTRNCSTFGDVPFPCNYQLFCTTMKGSTTDTASSEFTMGPYVATIVAIFDEMKAGKSRMSSINFFKEVAKRVPSTYTRQVNGESIIEEVSRPLYVMYLGPDHKNPMSKITFSFLEVK